jgi:hypothetical protein
MNSPYCRHIRTTGRRCASFAMRGQSFCYPHRKSNERHRTLLRPDASAIIKSHNLDIDQLNQNPLVAEYYGIVKGPLLLDFPALEDRESIQLSISMLITALGQDRLDAKRATTMLYGLQIASANAGNFKPSSEHIITNTVIDEAGNEIAPDEDPAQVIERNKLLDALDEDDRLAEQDDDDDED